jgi:tRNA nucleotidyltransferase (CCA-adding enzyme)
VEKSSPNVVTRLSLFFHDIAKPLVAHFDEKGEQHYYGHPKKSAEITEKILSRLRFDNATKNKIITLVAFHDSPIIVNNSAEPDRKRLKKIMSQIGADLIYPLIEIKYCDNSAQNPLYYRGDEFYNQNKTIIDEIINENECFSVRSLAVNGDDLIKMGYKGKEIGNILNTLLDMVILVRE